MATRAFDLNIEAVLEHWEVVHALREIIANALDEQVMSETAEIDIYKDGQGDWHVRDYGRGLRIEHFTLNENQEKLARFADVIGKFGVGLKDALAAFHRKGVGVLIRSPYGTFRLKQEPKHGFASIVTLHVEYDDAQNDMCGTDFILRGVTDAEMASAKSLFLRFAGEDILETNAYGQILRRKESAARVYILGVFASEEPNFLFSYNITSLTDSMRRRLNRERLNVARTTYADRVKAILRNARSEVVQDLLIDQVDRRASGDQCDEMGWVEISEMALKLMYQRHNVAYLTEQELQSRPGVVDSVRADGYRVVVITEQQKARLEAQAETGGLRVRTLEAYIQEHNASFAYKFVGIHELTAEERRVYDRTPDILALVGLSCTQVPPIRISETIRLTADNTGAVWDPSLGAIVVKRSQLSSLMRYAGILLHEAAHATTGTDDATREFEGVLTDYLGRTSLAAIGR